MSQLAYIKLEEAEVTSRLQQLEGWQLKGDKICKTWRFDNYKDGIVFAGAVGWAADRLNHHPDIEIGYGRVTVSVNTHDVGGLSPYDFELARRVDQL